MEQKKAKIYTCTGDSGATSLAGGRRVPKNHPRVEAYGTIDELNAHLGLLAAAVENAGTVEFIQHIECTLMSIGSYLATEDATEKAVPGHEIALLEKEIDRLEAMLPPLKCFILPGNSEAAARANVCRAVCRRAERNVVTLQQSTAIDPEVGAYMNRLSDYLFLLQRQLLEGKEKKWQKSCK